MEKGSKRDGDIGCLQLDISNLKSTCDWKHRLVSIERNSYIELRDAIQLILDFLNLEFKYFPSKTELIAKKSVKKEG